MFFCSWLKEISLVKWDVTPIILAFKILILSNSHYVHSCGKPFPLKQLTSAHATPARPRDRSLYDSLCYSRQLITSWLPIFRIFKGNKNWFKKPDPDREMGGGGD